MTDRIDDVPFLCTGKAVRSIVSEAMPKEDGEGRICVVSAGRPLVVTPRGVRLCRPSEAVLDLLPPQQGAFVKEDGERVVDEHGHRVATA